MALVQAEYADELSVLSTWIAVVLPWSVSYTDQAPFGSIVAVVRLGIFEIQLRFPSSIDFNGVPVDVEAVLAGAYSGFEVWRNLYVDVPQAAMLFYGGPLAIAYAAYAVASLFLIGALILSIGMYFREEETRRRLPIAYPRLTGYVFVIAGVLQALATIVLLVFVPGTGLTVPIGIFVLAVLAYVLLDVEATDEAEAA